MAELQSASRSDIERVGRLVDATLVARELFLEGHDPFERVGNFILTARWAGDETAMVNQQVQWLMSNQAGESSLVTEGLSYEERLLRANQNARASAGLAHEWCVQQTWMNVRGFYTYCPKESRTDVTDLLTIMGLAVEPLGLAERQPDQERATPLAQLAMRMQESHWPMWAILNQDLFQPEEQHPYPVDDEGVRLASLTNFLIQMEMR